MGSRASARPKKRSTSGAGATCQSHAAKKASSKASPPSPSWHRSTSSCNCLPEVMDADASAQAKSLCTSPPCSPTTAVHASATVRMKTWRHSGSQSPCLEESTRRMARWGSSSQSSTSASGPTAVPSFADGLPLCLEQACSTAAASAAVTSSALSAQARKPSRPLAATTASLRASEPDAPAMTKPMAAGIDGPSNAAAKGSKRHVAWKMSKTCRVRNKAVRGCSTRGGPSFAVALSEIDITPANNSGIMAKLSNLSASTSLSSATRKSKTFDK
mmetsp:Transcript_62022/g.173176  ORF Transcript_62022/g.173176 Transcript_62022/m.173176 type:complete len:273 (-) Transcript_62022:967-1785(-)